MADAYVPGTEALGPGLLLEFRYTDDNVDMAFPTETRFDLSFDVSQQNFVFSTAQDRNSSPDGTWHMGAEGIDPNCPPDHILFCGYEAAGINGAWAKVPAGSSVVLLLSGVWLLRILARRLRLLRA